MSFQWWGCTIGRVMAYARTLVVGGAATAGMLTYWLIVPILIAGLVSVYGVRRANPARPFRNEGQLSVPVCLADGLG